MPRLWIDWRWPGKDAANWEEDVRRWIDAFERAFGPRPISLQLQKPIELDHPALLTLIDILSDHPHFHLVVSTLFDGVQQAFVRRVPLIPERCDLTVVYKPISENLPWVLERLIELRHSGVEATLMWAPQREDQPRLAELVETFADIGFPLGIFPERLATWDRMSSFRSETLLWRFAADTTLRAFFADPAVKGLPSWAGGRFITVYSDGSVSATPRQSVPKLGNVFAPPVELYSKPRPYPLDWLPNVEMALALPSFGFESPTGNPLRHFLEAGGVVTTSNGVRYPNRHSDWEDPAIATAFGLLPQIPKPIGMASLVEMTRRSLVERLRGSLARRDRRRSFEKRPR